MVNSSSYVVPPYNAVAPPLRLVYFPFLYQMKTAADPFYYGDIPTDGKDVALLN